MTENDNFIDLEDLYNLDRNFNELVNTGGNWENDGRVRSTRNVGMRNLPIVGLNLTLINNNVYGILYIRVPQLRKLPRLTGLHLFANSCNNTCLWL